MKELERAKAQYEAIEIPDELKLCVGKVIEEHENPSGVVEIPKGVTTSQARKISGGKHDWAGFKKFSLGFATAAFLCLGIFGVTFHYGVFEFNNSNKDEKVILPVKLSDGDSKQAQTISQPTENTNKETSKGLEETDNEKESSKIWR